MAKKQTILGKVSLTPKGTYDPQKAYEQLDIIEYKGSSYLVLQPFTGIEPVGDNKYTMALAKKGEAGKGISILGKFDTLDELKAAITNPEPGDAYGVLAESDPLIYHIYMYDGLRKEWINFGKLDGSTGKSAYDAYLEGGGDLSEQDFNESLQHVKDIRPKENIQDIFYLAIFNSSGTAFELDYNRVCDLYNKFATHDFFIQVNDSGIINIHMISQNEDMMHFQFTFLDDHYIAVLFKDDTNKTAEGICAGTAYVDLFANQTISGQKRFEQPILVKGKEVALVNNTSKGGSISKKINQSGWYRICQSSSYLYGEVALYNSCSTHNNKSLFFNFSSGYQDLDNVTVTQLGGYNSLITKCRIISHGGTFAPANYSALDIYYDSNEENTLYTSFSNLFTDAELIEFKRIDELEEGVHVREFDFHANKVAVNGNAVLTEKDIKIQEITEKDDDLNNYTQTGIYVCNNAAIIPSLKNYPATYNFVLSVISTSSGCIQLLTQSNPIANKQYIRSTVGPFWCLWSEIITEKNIKDFVPEIVDTTDLVTKSGDEVITGKKTFKESIFIELEDGGTINVGNDLQLIPYYLVGMAEFMSQEFDELKERIEALEKNNL